MRSLVCLTLLASLLAAPLPAAAQGASPDAATGARDHFRRGMRLYQDGNYSGALAEFQASYRLKPAGSTLQNIALCQKQLFRYAEAAESLSVLLLSGHSAEFDTRELEEVQRTLDELQQFIGTVDLQVTPDHAQVTVDGRRLTLIQRREPLRLSVGEYRIRAEAPGYAPLERVVRVSSGAASKLTLTLTAVKGFIDIQADNPDAEIAIDGKPVGSHRYSGPLEPGRHRVQVVQDGAPTFEEVVEVKLGETTTVRVGREGAGGAVEGSSKAPAGPLEDMTGFYALVGLNALGLTKNPQILDEKSEKSSGSSFGLQLGYRLGSLIGVEGLLEVAKHDVTACLANQVCEVFPDIAREYELRSFRFGANVRFFSNGERFRFSGSLGLGLVAHALEVEAPNLPSRPSSDDDGIDPALMVELGAQYSAGSWLLGLALLSHIDSTGRLSVDSNPAYEGNSLVTVGIGLRVGWASWRPR